MSDLNTSAAPIDNMMSYLWPLLNTSYQDYFAEPILDPSGSGTYSGWENVEEYMNPIEWLENWGMYLTPYDTNPDKTIMAELEISNANARAQALASVYDIKEGIGLSGFGSSYMMDKENLALNRLALTTQVNYANALTQKRSDERNYREQMNNDLIWLNELGAFDPGGVTSTLGDAFLGADTYQSPDYEGSQYHSGYWFDEEWNPWENTSYGGTGQGPRCPCPDGGQSPACCDLDYDYAEEDYDPDECGFFGQWC